MSAELTASLPGGAVVFTDRSHGNLSSVGGLGAEHGARSRAQLRERLALRSLARSFQVHGSEVRIVTEMPVSEPETADLVRADGAATAIPSLGVMVLAADCLPVAIARPGAVAMLHAGWRGLAGGVLETGARALAELAERVQEPSGRPVAVLGPCAGPCCYEVGPEVHAAFETGLDTKGPIDMRAIARRRLEAAGIGHVSELGGCTICDQRYFSYRREGEEAGRQAGVAWLS